MKFHKGVKVLATKNRKTVESTIQEYSEQFYLCQNHWNGGSCGDNLGYQYSWSIGYCENDDDFIRRCRIQAIYKIEIMNTEWDGEKNVNR